MPVVYIPSLMRGLTQGRTKVEVDGRTVGAVIEELDRLYPGVRARLVDGGRLSPGVSVAVDGEIAPLGLSQVLGEESEVHFLPAIGGG
jgi:sulfur-carrier protein